MPKIIPIKDLKNTAEVYELCHQIDEPIYLTKNGYGDMVIMSMDVFEDLYDQVKMYRSMITSENQMEDEQEDDAGESALPVKEN